ncbi:hypothetical protein [Enterococcus mundtii]|nr:hypothetical protein [Enterococcus mundtii]OJG59344.1 hypothetical protein RV08_GL001084 [Enterococcus mundtii]
MKGMILMEKESKRSNEVAQEVEQEFLEMMNQKHVKRMSVCEYISILLSSVEDKKKRQEEAKQKLRLLGAFKGFTNLQRTYIKQGRCTQLYLEKV